MSFSSHHYLSTIRAKKQNVVCICFGSVITFIMKSRRSVTEIQFLKRCVTSLSEPWLRILYLYFYLHLTCLIIHMVCFFYYSSTEDRFLCTRINWLRRPTEIVFNIIQHHCHLNALILNGFTNARGYYRMRNGIDLLIVKLFLSISMFLTFTVKWLQIVNIFGFINSFITIDLR